MLTNVLWELGFKLEMFVSSFHQFCLLVVSWICLALGSSTARVGHTPFLEQWGLSQQFGEMLFAVMVGKILTSHPEQHSQTAGEFQLPGALEQCTDSVEVQFA